MYILKQLLRRIFMLLTAVLSDKAEKERLERKFAKRKDGGTVLFSESYYLADHMASAGFMFSYLAYFVMILDLVGIIMIFALELIETQEDIRIVMFLVLMLVFSLIVSRIMRIVCYYYSDDYTQYYEDYLLVSKYRRDDVIVTYEELGQYIREKKIRVGHGRLELPLKKGMTPICIHEHPEMEQKEALLQFLNEKCNVDIPMLTKKEKILVRQSGLFPVGMKTFLATVLLDLFFVFGLYWIEEFGIHTFREVYIRTNLKEFCQTHAFMMIGLPFAMIGIGGELYNFIPLRVKLGKYKIFRF